MLNQTKKIAVVILAAGDGKRMGVPLPKVMIPFEGKPFLEYQMTTVESCSFEKEIIVVVNAKHTVIQDYLQSRANYAIQQEQRGTGHATGAAQSAVSPDVENVMVLYGDTPFVTRESLEKLAQVHVEQQNTLTLLTTTLPDFEDWRQVFYTSFGRIVRNSNGEIVKSVEFRDATDEEKNIREVNPCFYCFRADWLWKKIPEISNNNVQKEFYLTDLLAMALREHEPVGSVAISPQEALGINSKEEFDLATRVHKNVV